VAGAAPDWAHAANRFNPLTHTDPQRRRPMAVRRLHPQQIENLRVRWFAIGSLATLAPMAIVYGAIRLLGGA
jgi:hypothetical protein